MRVRAFVPILAATVALSASGASAQSGVGDPVYPSLGSAALDVQHYDIALSWFPGDGSIDARTTVTAHAKSALTSVELDLSGLSVTQVLVNGVAATYTRSGNKLLVTPQAAVPAGTTFTTQVAYGGKPRSLRDPSGTSEGWLRKNVGAITLNEPRGSMTWFPNNNTPGDKATYHVAIEVPQAFQAVSNGRNTAVIRSGVRDTWHWSVNEPMATYLATVDIGKFTRHTRTVRGVRYDSFIAKGLPSNAKPLRLLPRVVAFGERWFGKYPYADSGIIVDNPTVFYALELQNRPFFPGYAHTRILVHEIAHQWFGDSVTPRTWNHIWLNEGFATYAEWLWRAKHGGPSTRKAFREAFRSTSRWSPAPAKVKAKTLFSDAVYTRGAMTLQALRERVGTKVFFRILRQWARHNRHGNGTTYAFKKLAETVSGKQLDKLFRDWLHVAKRPRGYVR